MIPLNTYLTLKNLILTSPLEKLTRVNVVGSVVTCVNVLLEVSF